MPAKIIFKKPPQGEILFSYCGRPVPFMCSPHIVPIDAPFFVSVFQQISRLVFPTRHRDKAKQTGARTNCRLVLEVGMERVRILVIRVTQVESVSGLETCESELNHVIGE